MTDSFLYVSLTSHVISLSCLSHLDPRASLGKYHISPLIGGTDWRGSVDPLSRHTEY